MMCTCDELEYASLSPWQAKSIAQPFAYEQYRKEKIQKKMEEAKANRARRKVMLP